MHKALWPLAYGVDFKFLRESVRSLYASLQNNPTNNFKL